MGAVTTTGTGSLTVALRSEREASRSGNLPEREALGSEASEASRSGNLHERTGIQGLTSPVEWR